MRMLLLLTSLLFCWNLLASDDPTIVITVHPGENVTIDWGINVKASHSLVIISKDGTGCAKFWYNTLTGNEHKGLQCKKWQTSHSGLWWKLRAGGFKSRSLIVGNSTSSLYQSFVFTGDPDSGYKYWDIITDYGNIKIRDFSQLWALSSKCGEDFSCWNKEYESKYKSKSE